MNSARDLRANIAEIAHTTGAIGDDVLRGLAQQVRAGVRAGLHVPPGEWPVFEALYFDAVLYLAGVSVKFRVSVGEAQNLFENRKTSRVPQTFHPRRQPPIYHYAVSPQTYQALLRADEDAGIVYLGKFRQIVEMLRNEGDWDRFEDTWAELRAWYERSHTQSIGERLLGWFV